MKSIFDFVKEEMEFYFEDVFPSNNNEPVLKVFEEEFINACKVITSFLFYDEGRNSTDLKASVAYRSLFVHFVYLGDDETGDPG